MLARRANLCRQWAYADGRPAVLAARFFIVDDRLLPVRGAGQRRRRSGPGARHFLHFLPTVAIGRPHETREPIGAGSDARTLLDAVHCEPRSSRRRRGCWRAPKDMYYWTPDGRQVLDGTAGLWCVNAGHCRKPIVEAVQKQAATMDYAPPFSMGHPLAFEAATAVAQVAPAGMQRVFFTNSGSESADTRDQDGARLPPRTRRAEPTHHHRPRARLPRRQRRWHDGRRNSRQPQGVSRR